jgi:hypothetical protein
MRSLSQCVSRSTDRAPRAILPIGHTLALALMLFGLLMGLGEVLVRTRVFRAAVVASNRGGRHGQFELQLGRLETIEARDGPIDCFFLGNSMVWHSFDPQAFAEGYRKQTGHDIRCFNFGIDGLTPIGAGALAPILAGDHHPSVLIYGTTARDMAVRPDAEDNTVFLEMPWLRYRGGQFSVQGWFYDHSRLYQYWETLGQLARLQKSDLLLPGFYASSRNNYGFYGREGVSTTAGMILEPGSQDRHIRMYFELLSKYDIIPENLAGLEQVMALNDREVQVLIVEMPIPPTYMRFFRNGQQDYKQFLERVEKQARLREIPFWQTTKLGLIPEDGWFDYVYPNTKGAWIWSEWLGEQLGKAVLQGQLENPVAKR